MAAKPLRCRLGIHKWVAHHEPETGEGYFECARCGKEQSPRGPSVPGVAG